VVRNSTLGWLPLTPATLTALADCARTTTFKRGERLFGVGDRADCFIVVIRGDVAIESFVPSGASSQYAQNRASLNHSRRLSLSSTPPIAASSLKTTRLRRMSLPLPSSTVLSQPLQAIRESPAPAIIIAKSNLNSPAKFKQAEEDSEDVEEFSPTTASGYTSPPSATTIQSRSAFADDAPRSNLLVHNALVYKHAGDVFGGEGLLRTGSSPQGRRLYAARCSSESLQILVIPYSDLSDKVFQPLSTALTTPLYQILSTDWLLAAIRSAPAFRGLPAQVLPLFAVAFSPERLTAGTTLATARKRINMEDAYIILFEGELNVVTTLEGIATKISDTNVSASSSASIAESHHEVLRQCVLGGECVGDDALAPVASTHRSSIQVMASSIVLRLARRSFLSLMAHVSGRALLRPVPTLLDTLLDTLQLSAGSIEAAVATAAQAAETGNGAMSRLSIMLLSKYSDADLLHHPLFQKMLYSFAKSERQPHGLAPQHELLEFWRDTVNYRKSTNRTQMSAEAEARILLRAYLDPAAVKFQRHLPPAMRVRLDQRIEAGSCTPYLFASAEELSESLLIAGPLARFKLSSAFVKSIPFVRMDAKWIARNKASRMERTAHIGSDNGSNNAAASVAR